MSDERRTVAVDAWHDALARVLRDHPHLDFLGAVDEIGRPGPSGREDDLRVVCRLLGTDGNVRVEVWLPRADPVLSSVADLVPGASWYERETAEMFGIVFAGGDPRHLLLPDAGQPGAQSSPPLRKDTILGARVQQPWPGGREGDSPSGSRRRTMPPGVPDPRLWGDRPVDAPDPDPAEVAGERMRRRR